MAWQLTTAAARLGRALGLRRRWTGAAAVARALGLASRAARADGDTAASRAYARRLAHLPEAERFAVAKALVDLDPEGRAASERALASGAPPRAVVAFARAWGDLGLEERGLAISPLPEPAEGPVEVAGVPAAQVDQTTCGAASMAIMLIVGDPLVGVWLASGRTMAGHVPPEVRRIPPGVRLDTAERRWRALQRSIHVHTVRRGFLLLLPWPRGLGTPPWRVNNHTRFLDLRFRGAIVDDTDDADVDALIAHASAALHDGIPVPLYAQGDSARGLDTVVPRHVVLLTHRFPGGFFAYEPASARLHTITDAQIRRGGRGLRALGNWSHVAWLILPRPRRTT